jgi:hypothetical protein
MAWLQCGICNRKRSVFKSLCTECTELFDLVQKNMGKMGMGQLMDILISTGIDKPRIKFFLEADAQGKGSIMDQITATLTNNLAEGIGVKGKDMTPDDVKKLRNNPTQAASTKPIES